MGRLAQLVQSTWFTPKGSGVRLPHRPLLNYTDIYYRAISSVGSEHLVYTQGVGGSTPSSPTKPYKSCEAFLLKGENSSVGRARPCQGRGRGFESRFSLQGCSSGGIGRHARLKILCPLGRAGSSPASSTR